VRADKAYDEYWASGQHASPEWDEKTFRKVMGPMIGLGSVLDYGCGLGYAYQARLSRSVQKYVGADVSPLAVQNAQSKGLEAGLINPDDGRIDASSNAFDGVTCVEVMEHLYDPLQAAREIHRVLKPGGLLLLTVPNFGYHAWRLLALLRAQVPSEGTPENKWNGPHIRFYSKLTLSRMLRAAGFTDLQVGPFDNSSVWDVFLAAGHMGHISAFANRHLPPLLNLRFLENVWPNVFARRLRVLARKPGA
jgi:SAM-dependent methyltransferase